MGVNHFFDDMMLFCRVITKLQVDFYKNLKLKKN